MFPITDKAYCLCSIKVAVAQPLSKMTLLRAACCMEMQEKWLQILVLRGILIRILGMLSYLKYLL